jgi:hypothetical protein
MPIRLIASAVAQGQSRMLLVETQLLQSSNNSRARVYAIRYQRTDCNDRVIVTVWTAAIKHVSYLSKSGFGGCRMAGLRYDNAGG